MSGYCTEEEQCPGCSAVSESRRNKFHNGQHELQSIVTPDYRRARKRNVLSCPGRHDTWKGSLRYRYRDLEDTQPLNDNLMLFVYVNLLLQAHNI